MCAPVRLCLCQYAQAMEREEEEKKKDTEAILMGNPLLVQQDSAAGIKRRYARGVCVACHVECSVGRVQCCVVVFVSSYLCPTACV